MHHIYRYDLLLVLKKKANIFPYRHTTNLKTQLIQLSGRGALKYSETAVLAANGITVSVYWVGAALRCLET